MRRIVLTYIFLSVIGIWGAMAQNTLNPMNNRDRFGNQIDPNTQPDNLEDSTNTEIQSLPPKLYMWKLSETLGNRTIIPADTASLNFQSTNLVEGMFGHYNYLGNLGSPRLSRLFFEREESEPTIFMAPFSSFFTRPDQVLFTNSNVPYTNLTYYKAGSKVNGEERFKSYFSVNVNKQLAFGFNIDYLYGRGYYQNQSTSHFNAGLFGSYIGEKYQVQAVYNNFFLKMNENGGIAISKIRKMYLFYTFICQIDGIRLLNLSNWNPQCKTLQVFAKAFFQTDLFSFIYGGCISNCKS